MDDSLGPLLEKDKFIADVTFVLGSIILLCCSIEIPANNKLRINPLPPLVEVTGNGSG